MNYFIASLCLVFALSSNLSLGYQVTGKVVDSTDSKIVIQKGKEKFEIARDATTKTEGNPAVGSKATVEYTMAASSIVAKAEKDKK